MVKANHALSNSAQFSTLLIYSWAFGSNTQGNLVSRIEINQLITN